MAAATCAAVAVPLNLSTAASTRTGHRLRGRHARTVGVKADCTGSLSVMAVTVRIPTTLRPMAGGASTVQVEGATLSEVIANLDATHPGFKDRLLDDSGALRKFVNLFVADDDVRYLQGLDTPVPAGETVSIIPAVAGG